MTNDYKYTTDWFSTNIPSWKQSLLKYKDTECKILEIGSFEGRSCIWLCENILLNANSHIDCIDIFTDANQFELFKHNTQFFADKVSWFQGNSNELLQQEPFVSNVNHYDIIYIDGSHDAEFVFKDAFYSFNKLKVGGTLIFDDVDGGAPGVLFALNEFLNIFGTSLKLEQDNYQRIYTKIRE